MTRPKFKIWDKQEKKWYEPVYEAYKGELDDLKINLDGRLCRYTTNKMEDESIFLDRYEIVQYTGFKDKNDNEIYFGDIIIFRHQDMSDKSQATNDALNPLCYGDIKYEYGHYYIDDTKMKPYLSTVYCREIKGNIFEIPELLEPK